MKATIEIDMPSCCYFCRLKRYDLRITEHICCVNEHVITKSLLSDIENRDINCPLIPVER